MNVTWMQKRTNRMFVRRISLRMRWPSHPSHPRHCKHSDHQRVVLLDVELVVNRGVAHPFSVDIHALAGIWCDGDVVTERKDQPGHHQHHANAQS